MEIKNYLEDIVFRVANDLIDKDKDCCKCEQCRADIMARSLTNLKPKYAPNVKGHAVTAVDIESEQVQAEVTVKVLEALESIKKHPNH